MRRLCRCKIVWKYVENDHSFLSYANSIIRFFFSSVVARRWKKELSIRLMCARRADSVYNLSIKWLCLFVALSNCFAYSLHNASHAACLNYGKSCLQITVLNCEINPIYRLIAIIGNRDEYGHATSTSWSTPDGTCTIDRFMYSIDGITNSITAMTRQSAPLEEESDKEKPTHRKRISKEIKSSKLKLF